MRRYSAGLLLSAAIFSASFFCAVEVAAQKCVCRTCQNPNAQQTPEWKRYWRELRDDGRERHEQEQDSLPENLLENAQVVFLDFDTGEDASFVYTTAQRNEVQQNMEEIFAGFQVTFTPVSYTHLTLPTKA